MIVSLVKSFVFDKMAAYQKKTPFFVKKFTLQNGLKNRTYCQKSYSFNTYLRNISMKHMKKFMKYIYD